MIKALAGRCLTSYRPTHTFVLTQETFWVQTTNISVWEEWFGKCYFYIIVHPCVGGLQLWPVGKWRPGTPRWLDQRHSPLVWWTGCTFWRVSWRGGPPPWRKSILSRHTERESECGSQRRVTFALYDTSRHKHAKFVKRAKKMWAWAQRGWSFSDIFGFKATYFGRCWNLLTLFPIMTPQRGTEQQYCSFSLICKLIFSSVPLRD